MKKSIYGTIKEEMIFNFYSILTTRFQWQPAKPRNLHKTRIVVRRLL